MKITQRRAVSPIIATLLLIAISVASGVVVYVFTSGLAGSLTKSHIGQVTEQLSLAAYSYATPSTSLTMYVQNTGTGTVNIATGGTAAYYQNGVVVTPSAVCGSASTLTPGATCSVTFTVGSGGFVTETPQSAVTIKVITADGGIFNFNVVAGQTG